MRPALIDRDALGFGPRPDITAARPARGGAARLAAPGFAGVLDEGRQLLAERGGILGAQVDLILRPAEGEPHGLIGRAATEVVFQRDGYSLCHFGLRSCTWISALYPVSMTGYCRNGADHMECLPKVITLRGAWAPRLRARTPIGVSHSVIGPHGRTRENTRSICADGGFVAIGILGHADQVALCTESNRDLPATLQRGSAAALRRTPACRWQACGPSAATLSDTPGPEASMIQKPPGCFWFPAWIGLGPYGRNPARSVRRLCHLLPARPG